MNIKFTAKLSCILYKRQLVQQTARTPTDYCIYYKTYVLKMIILLVGFQNYCKGRWGRNTTTAKEE